MTRKWRPGCGTWAPAPKIFRQPAKSNRGEGEQRRSEMRKWRRYTDREKRRERRMLVSWNLSCGKVRVGERIRKRKEEKGQPGFSRARHHSAYSHCSFRSTNGSVQCFNTSHLRPQTLTHVSVPFLRQCQTILLGESLHSWEKEFLAPASTVKLSWVHVKDLTVTLVHPVQDHIYLHVWFHSTTVREWIETEISYWWCHDVAFHSVAITNSIYTTLMLLIDI